MSYLRKYINEKTVIKDEIYQQFETSICCVICTDIIIDPMMCMNCQAQYCKECIENWKKKATQCTNRCKNANYKKSLLAQGLLSKLKFICIKCEKIIDYDDMKNHSLINCENEDKLKILRESTIKDSSMEVVKSMYIKI